MFPVNHIGTDGMSPMHWSPNRAVGIVLVKQVVFTFGVNHSIGIVHPIGFRSKVILRGGIALNNKLVANFCLTFFSCPEIDRKRALLL
jgi:hypothetical protein